VQVQQDDPVPAHTVIASPAVYREAQRAVDHLAGPKVAVKRVALAATGLRLVEQAMDETSRWQVADNVARSGARVGTCFDLIVGLLSQRSGLGARFPSVGGMQAGRSNVLADDAVTEEATRPRQSRYTSGCGLLTFRALLSYRDRRLERIKPCLY
jgi:hypothetical protein